MAFAVCEEGSCVGVVSLGFCVIYCLVAMQGNEKFSKLEMRELVKSIWEKAILSSFS